MSQRADQPRRGSAGRQAPTARGESEQASNGEFVPSDAADVDELATARPPRPVDRRAVEPGGVTKVSDVDIPPPPSSSHTSL